MAEVALTKLRGKLHVKHGWSFKGKHFATTGKYILLTPGNFLDAGGFKFDPAKAKYYASNFPEEYLCAKGDLVVVMTEQTPGLLGSTAFVPESGRFLHNQRIGLVTVDDSCMDKTFVYYLFNTASVRKQLHASSSGSKVKHTSPDRIYEVLAPIPELPVQQRIGQFLAALDDKIALNTRINAELEAMAKLLYDYWFVQFDFPNAKGKPYKCSGGAMVYNAELKREVPEGWEVGTLRDIANITMGQSPPGSSYNESGDGSIFYQGCTDFGTRYPTSRQYTTAPTRFAKAGDILLSVRAPVGTMNIAIEDCCIGRGVSALNSKSGAEGFLWSTMQYFKQIFDRWNVAGTTFGAIGKDDLHGLKVVLADPKVIEAFEAIVKPMYQQQNILESQNRELTTLRDWLLPMLMNGQVVVGEAEEKVGLAMAAEGAGKYGKHQS